MPDAEPRGSIAPTSGTMAMWEGTWERVRTGPTRPAESASYKPARSSGDQPRESPGTRRNSPTPPTTSEAGSRRNGARAHHGVRCAEHPPPVASWRGLARGVVRRQTEPGLAPPHHRREALRAPARPARPQRPAQRSGPASHYSDTPPGTGPRRSGQRHTNAQSSRWPGRGWTESRPRTCP